MKIRDMVFAGIITAVFGVNGAFVEAQTKPRKTFPSYTDPRVIFPPYRMVCTCELTNMETLQSVTISVSAWVTPPDQPADSIPECNRNAAAQGANMNPKALLLTDCTV